MVESIILKWASRRSPAGKVTQLQKINFVCIIPLIGSDLGYKKSVISAFIKKISEVHALEWNRKLFDTLSKFKE